MIQLPLYSVVIPTYGEKGAKLVENLLQTLSYSCRLPHEIIVVDDGSSEEVASRLDGLCRTHGAIHLHNAENKGFGAACDAGISVANGHIVILHNNDVIPINDALDHLADFTMFTGIGIVGCKLLYPDNRIQHAGVYYQPDARGGPGWFDHILRFQDRYLPDACRITNRLVTGALMAINGNLINGIGMLDTRLGMACEDIDLCLRAFEIGSAVAYNGRIEAYHLEGATRGNTPELKALHPEWTQAEERSFSQFFDKWQGLNFKQFSLGAKE